MQFKIRGVAVGSLSEVCRRSRSEAGSRLGDVERVECVGLYGWNATACLDR